MLANILLIMNAGVTLFLCGLIWVVQIVHYPLFNLVQPDKYAKFEHEHIRKITWIVLVPMLLEVFTAILLCVYTPIFIPKGLVIFGVLLVVLIWLSTFLLQVPCHHRLKLSFDDSVHRRLVKTNWVRTWLWTARSIIVLYMLFAAM